MVGLSRMGNPVKNYFKNSGITLPEKTDNLNEARGTGGAQFLAAVVIVLGIFIAEFNLTANLVAVVIFLGFALGRIVSITSDGKPNKQIIQGLVFELVFGAMNFVCLLF